jgi:hypothetical protein
MRGGGAYKKGIVSAGRDLMLPEGHVPALFTLSHEESRRAIYALSYEGIYPHKSYIRSRGIWKPTWAKIMSMLDPDWHTAPIGHHRPIIVISVKASNLPLALLTLGEKGLI